MWNLPGPRIEPVFPALADRFLVTVPPGKSKIILYLTMSHSKGFFPNPVFSFLEFTRCRVGVFSLSKNVRHGCPYSCLWGWLLRMKFLEWTEKVKLSSCSKHVVLEITFCCFKMSLKICFLPLVCPRGIFDLLCWDKSACQNLSCLTNNRANWLLL